MSWSDIAAVVALLIPVPAAVLAWFKLRFESRQARQAEYQFVKEFLGEVDTLAKRHPLVWERGFYALTGIPGTSIALGETLLSARGGSWAAIRRYRASGRQYLTFDEITRRFSWKPLYRPRIVRGTINVFCGVWYVCGISIGFLVFQLLSTSSSLSWSVLIVNSVANLLLFFGTATLAFITPLRLGAAEELLRQINGEPKPHRLMVSGRRRLRFWLARRRSTI